MNNEKEQTSMTVSREEKAILSLFRENKLKAYLPSFMRVRHRAMHDDDGLLKSYIRELQDVDFLLIELMKIFQKHS